MDETDTIAIGDWRFHPDTNDLVRGEEKRRLEDRAGRTLALLAARRGEVVSKAELYEKIWNGRQLSDNSLAVVIADLRKALGDDARSPRCIETVAKRGYRLMPEAAGAAAPAQRSNTARRAAASIAALAAATVALVAGLSGLRHAAVEPSVVIEDVVNETGSARYDSLAHAAGALVVSDLKAAQPSLRLRLARTGTPPEPDANAPPRSQLRLTARLTLWDGYPTVTFAAIDRRTGEMVWSDRAGGRPGSLPVQLGQSVAEFLRQVKPAR